VGFPSANFIATSIKKKTRQGKIRQNKTKQNKTNSQVGV